MQKPLLDNKQKSQQTYPCSGGIRTRKRAAGHQRLIHAATGIGNFYFCTHSTDKISAFHSALLYNNLVHSRKTDVNSERGK